MAKCRFFKPTGDDWTESTEAVALRFRDVDSIAKIEKKLEAAKVDVANGCTVTVFIGGEYQGEVDG